MPVLDDPDLSASSYVKKALQSHAKKQLALESEDPFFVCDLNHLSDQTDKWHSLLPRAKPHYGKSWRLVVDRFQYADLTEAVKCNPDINILRSLAKQGLGFDCASPHELDLVLSLAVAPSRIIFANPCKARSAIRYARQHGVAQMTFDNESELHKIKSEFPDARLVLRILADDETATCRLGLKFGASPSESASLLKVARRLDLDVIGISFHVGSGAKDVNAFDKAISEARTAWVYAKRLSFDMSLLDIGGGFEADSLPKMAPPINASLDYHFGDVACEIIAEPGRYFAEGAYTLGCKVIAERWMTPSSNSGAASSAMLYLSDGVFGTFGNCVYEKAQYVPHVLNHGTTFFPEDSPWNVKTEEDVTYSLWGPTCDSSDCINKGCQLRSAATEGDWLYFEKMGGG